jgi:hypothetical protein
MPPLPSSRSMTQRPSRAAFRWGIGSDIAPRCGYGLLGHKHSVATEASSVRSRDLLRATVVYSDDCPAPTLSSLFTDSAIV